MKRTIIVDLMATLLSGDVFNRCQNCYPAGDQCNVDSIVHGCGGGGVEALVCGFCVVVFVTVVVVMVVTVAPVFDSLAFITATRRASSAGSHSAKSLFRMTARWSATGLSTPSEGRLTIWSPTHMAVELPPSKLIAEQALSRLAMKAPSCARVIPGMPVRRP